jgi:hypothetical protein
MWVDDDGGTHVRPDELMEFCERIALKNLEITYAGMLEQLNQLNVPLYSRSAAHGSAD